MCYKCTGILEDQVLVGGTAVGGLSQVALADFRTCSLATRLAGEISQFGHPPEVSPHSKLSVILRQILQGGKHR